MLGKLSRRWLVAAATVATLVALPATAQAAPFPPAFPPTVTANHTVSGPPTCDGVQMTVEAQQVGTRGTPQVYRRIDFQAPAECRAGTRIIYSNYLWDMAAGRVMSAHRPVYEVIDAGGETFYDEATSGLWWGKLVADVKWLRTAVVHEVQVCDGDVCSDNHWIQINNRDGTVLTGVDAAMMTQTGYPPAVRAPVCTPADRALIRCGASYPTPS